ncbi:MAG TPA: hypothetical protein VH306_09020 [Gaiellaceae bacterium]
MALLLSCELCGRKQADGLLSRAAWGHLEVEDGRTLRACAGCKGSTPDWEDRLRTTAGSVPPPSTGFGAASPSFVQRPTS